jgi:hypothetical protein
VVDFNEARLGLIDLTVRDCTEDFSSRFWVMFERLLALASRCLSRPTDAVPARTHFSLTHQITIARDLPWRTTVPPCSPAFFDIDPVLTAGTLRQPAHRTSC